MCKNNGGKKEQVQSDRERNRTKIIIKINTNDEFNEASMLLY
jgi:hypothetical protein